MITKLTNVERLTLLNQFKILNRIIPQSEQDLNYTFCIEVLQQGFEHEYDEIISNSMFEEMPKEDSSFVWNVLSAYRCIYQSFHKLQNSESLNNLTFNDIRFKGFDGNEHGRHLAYCEFIINDMERFDEFKGYSLNTHMSILSWYQGLLERFDSFDELMRDTLTEKDIKYILNIKD